MFYSGTSTVEVVWETPDQLNGVLERYILYSSKIEGELGVVVYNNTDLFLDYVITDLSAGSTYYIAVAVCTTCLFSFWFQTIKYTLASKF